MKDIVIIGAGALGQEVAWLIEEINEKSVQWNILGFLDDFAFSTKKTILGYPCIGSFKDVANFKDASFILGFGDPRLTEKIYNEINGENLNWATLISPTVRIHKSNKIGKGVVIGRNADLTVNCTINDFVYINIHVVLGHEVEVDKFSIISPNVTINGGGKIGKACQIGANAFIKDVFIGDYSTVGASSCVIKTVEEYSVVAGVPAKVLHKGTPTKSISRSERH
ncbi:MAG: NeuD/PglB/VioB family sugar acetyltransferase [Bacteroidetes bacterium]|nr:NeuD/PglB/VioB family sugar acetyltransferase [Bacteroidota bacterium]